MFDGDWRHPSPRSRRMSIALPSHSLNNFLSNPEESMSSWSQSTQRKRIRLGYHQPTPVGKFEPKSQPATIVTAYYPLQKSKYTTKHYEGWLKHFLSNCEGHMVIFTDTTTVPFIEQLRSAYKNRTKVIVLDPSKWTSTTQFPKSFWEEQHQMDPEKAIHSIELYKVWYEKKEFVKRAIALNPWNHTDFVWCDAGICRSESFAKLIKHFPVASRIPTNKFLLCNVGEYTEKDEQVYMVNGVPIQGGASGKNRIGGGIVAASKELWATYDTLYEQIVDKYIQARLFIGKEQNILETLVLEHREQVSLVEPKPIGPELWFYLALWLSVGSNAFKRMNDASHQMKQMSYEELAALDH